MQVVILCAGSRGDVQPNVALGRGLLEAGHRVRIATHAPFKELVTGCGLDFVPMEGDPQRMLEGARGQAWLAAGRNPLRFMRTFVGLTRPMLERYMADSWDACRGAEAIIFSTVAFPGYHVAERLGIPCFGSGLQPFSRTRTYPAMSTPSLGLGSYNMLTHILAEQLAWQPFRQSVNLWRQETLGLPPIPFAGPFSQVTRQRVPYLYGYSPLVAPKPPDWPDWLHVTGYWFLDGPQGWEPPAGLVEFLQAGPPPVYVGFGSMVGSDPKQTTDLVVRALRLVGQRGILLGGWAGLGGGDLPEDVYSVDAIPHDWLFPRVAAVVHHGGAGTTAAGLRAGLPNVITPFTTSPFFGDQLFWGQRVYQLGVGPRPVPQKKLTAEGLAAAIRAVTTDEGIRARARALGERIRAEDGVARAVEVFDRHCREWRKG